MRSFVLARLAVSLQPLLVLFSDRDPVRDLFPLPTGLPAFLGS